MGRRRNPYDNAKAESFMKTLKVEEVYLMEYETFEDVAATLPHFIEACAMPSVATRRSATRAPSRLKRSTPGRWSIQQVPPVHPKGCTPNYRQRKAN